jgi:CrcB protein
MRHLIAIALGGAAGSLLRYGLSLWVYALLGRGFPYGTLVVNVLGCFFMGVLFVFLVERLSDDTLWRAALLIGLLGAFTTFSTFTIETFNLMEEGQWLKAALNMGLSLFLCVSATGIGVVLGRQL